MLIASALIIPPLAACAAPVDNALDTATEAVSNAVNSSRLQTILDRGELICGIEGTIPGFSNLDGGNYSGLDVDVCRAVAAALFNDPEAVSYRQLDSSERFTALKTGEVDMLSRNTTWTLSRDATGGNTMEFAPTTFYDAQGMMVRADSGITELTDLEGLSICVEQGTTTELNLASRMSELGVQYEEATFGDGDKTSDAYTEGRCDGFTSDKSQLFARRTKYDNPADHIILDVSMSKEPLGPVTMNNDSQWFDVVKWVTYGLIQAEEFGITQANVAEIAETTPNEDIRSFLGVQGEFGDQLGIDNQFMFNAITAVGNYGEIYDRNIGDGIDRGLNRLWTDGGLMYSPPFR